MMKLTTIGLDLAKNIFQVHGTDERGKAILRKTLKRGAEVLCQFACVPDRDGGVRERASLGAQTDRTRSYGEADGAAVREAVREDEQERRT